MFKLPNAEAAAGRRRACPQQPQVDSYPLAAPNTAHTATRAARRPTAKVARLRQLVNHSKAIADANAELLAELSRAA